MAYRSTNSTDARLAAARERIAAAALDQVAEGGYSSASMQAVAGRAGVAVGTVYRHFDSKAALFAEIFRRASERELEVIAGVVADRDGPVEQRVAAGVEAFCRRALAGSVLAHALLAEPVDPGVEGERLRLRRGYRDVFAAALEAGVAAGELEPHDSPTVAAALVGALGEALVGPLSRHEVRSEALVATLVQFSVRSLPTKEPSSAPARAHA